MKLSLSENIRSLRKQRKMTQEKLAEALGVTVGAVYKWESGQSQPESFRAVYECASVFLVYGAANHDLRQLKRALELFERSRMLLPQNDDPRISDATICGNLSIVRFLLGEQEKSLELLKKNNAGGIFSSDIGAFCLKHCYREHPPSSPRFSGMCSCFAPETTGLRPWIFSPGGSVS